MLGYVTPTFLKPSSFYIHLPANEDGTVWSETSVCKIQTPANYQEEMLGYITPIFLKPSSFYTHLPAYEDGTECSETSACKIQTPANYPEESIQHSEQGESLKSRMFYTSQLPLHTFCAMIYFWCVAHDTLTKNECAST